MNEKVEEARPASGIETRATWIPPEVSRLDSSSAQAAEGASPDSETFS